MLLNEDNEILSVFLFTALNLWCSWFSVFDDESFVFVVFIVDSKLSVLTIFSKGTSFDGESLYSWLSSKVSRWIPN